MALLECEDSVTGVATGVNSINGAVPVTTMSGGVVHIREINALTTTAETLDWSANPIKAMAILVVPEAVEVIIPHTAVICIDPPNSAVRDAWLTAADSLTADSQRIPVIAGAVTATEFSFTGPVSYVGIKVDLGASACRVFAIGVEA